MSWNRILSLIIYAAYLIVAIINGDKGTWPIASVALLLPLGCIWFGDELGGYVGLASNLIFISDTTPGIFIQIIGWVFLLMPAAVLYFWH